MARKANNADEIAELVEVIRKHAPAVSVATVEETGGLEAHARAMVRAAKRMHRLAEHACNRSLTEAEEREDDELTTRWRVLCKAIGCGSKVTGDPRGFVARILFPPDAEGRVAYNTWGGAESGWGVA